MRAILLAALSFLVLAAAHADGVLLAPYKDRLFAYPRILAVSDEGYYRVVDYHEMRDINGRDSTPERRVKSAYVSSRPRRFQDDLVLETGHGKVAHFAVGRTKNASVITLYLHGQGGSRKQGVNDYSFGGNFNRIKNLMVRAGGLYLSPDFDDFEDRGTEQVAALIAHYASNSPGAPVFVACGSAGGGLCWRLARHNRASGLISGYLLLGSFWDESFLSSPAFRRRVPLLFGHGSHDTVFPIEHQEAFFRSIRARSPGYPALFVRFETGTHGTPIRMTDWRETLNWMLKQPR